MFFLISLRQDFIINKYKNDYLIALFIILEQY